MDTLKRLPTGPNTSTRHPSAEDLDAAHQLVSSARGGRDRGADSRPEGRGSGPDNGESLSSSSNMDLSPGSGILGYDQHHHPQGQSPSPVSNRSTSSRLSPNPQAKDSNPFGHSCV